jgi:tetratricopeptide (TPR) repeat protein
LAALLEDISLVRNAQGAKDEELVALNQEALKEREADPESTPENLAAGYNNLALAYVHANQLDRALQLFQKAHDLFVQAKGESYVTATSLANIGGVQFRMGRSREGLSNQLAAREMFRRIGIDSHQMLTQVLLGICETETQLELNEQAQAACDEAVTMIAHVQGESHPRFVRALALRAGAEISASHFDAATLDLDRARTIVTGIKGDPAPAFRALDMVTAKMDWLHGDYPQLRKHLGPSIAVALNAGAAPVPILFAWFAFACEHAPGDGCGGDDVGRANRVLADLKFAHHPDQLPAQIALAQIELLHGDANKAIERIEKGLAIATPELGDKHSRVGEAHLVMGDARKALGDTAAADREYAAAAAILGALPPAHPLRIEAESRLAGKR